MPLAGQLATVIANDSRREKLLTFSDRESKENGVIRDFFDGSAYQDQKALFSRELDLAIAIYIDGFVPFRKGTSNMTIYNIILLNLPATER